MATAESIWRVPAYLPYLQPALTADAVAAAEADIGHSLPVEYLDLLRKQNGGYIRFSLLESPHDTIAGIGPHFPSLIRVDWEECQKHVSYPLDNLIPFDGDGHWHLCLDYRGDSRHPAITFVEIERDRETHIADSFAAYLALLRIRVEDEVVFQAPAGIATITTELYQALGIRFEIPDAWASGYPVYRARMGTSANPEWLWISPNRVPRGFVRQGDPGYSQLRALLPGTAERYPGLPADSYILHSTPGVQARVADACVRIGLSTQPLRDLVQSARAG